VQDYQRSRMIAAAPCSARTIVDVNIEMLLRDAATAWTALRRLEFPRVRIQESATSFCRFITNHIQKLRRRTVENGAVKTRLLGDIATRLLKCATCRSAHVTHRKLLGSDKIVLSHQPRRQLMQDVLAACSERRKRLGQRTECLAPLAMACWITGLVSANWDRRRIVRSRLRSVNATEYHTINHANH